MSTSFVEQLLCNVMHWRRAARLLWPMSFNNPSRQVMRDIDDLATGAERRLMKIVWC